MFVNRKKKCCFYLIYIEVFFLFLSREIRHRVFVKYRPIGYRVSRHLIQDPILCTIKLTVSELTERKQNTDKKKENWLLQLTWNCKSTIDNWQKKMKSTKLTFTTHLKLKTDNWQLTKKNEIDKIDFYNSLEIENWQLTKKNENWQFENSHPQKNQQLTSPKNPLSKLTIAVSSFETR